MAHSIQTILKPIKKPASSVGNSVSLGNYPKNFDNGINTGLEPNQADQKNRYIRERRIAEYELLHQARDIYLADAKKQNLEHKFNRHKTAKCRYISTGRVKLNANSERANYSNLVKCSRVWTCPCCASSIQQERAVEIGQAVTWAHTNGYKPMMFTFTHPHTRNNEFKLKETIKAKQSVLKELRASREWKSLKAFDYQGFIRSLEVTIGKNGWHVHTHELVFVSPETTTAELHLAIFDRYKTLCLKHGLLNPDDRRQIGYFYDHALDIQDNADCSAYLAKAGSTQAWGVDAEMAKSSKKTSDSQKTKSPFSLLENRSPKNDRLWLEYSDALHGQKQLNWSVGLKAKVGIGEVSDDAVIEAETDSMGYLAEFTKKQWNFIRKNRLQAQILNLVEQSLPDVPKAIRRLNDYFQASGQPTLRYCVLSKPEPPV